jgi:HK97 family phage major capsid protein
MSDAVKKLLERRANLVNQMREVAERAVDENRDMSADENRQFTEMNAEVDALQERADAMLAGEKRAKEIEDSFASLSGKPQERQTPEQGKGEAELRSFLRGESGRFFDVPVEHRDVLKSGSGANVVPTSMDSQLWEYMIEESSILGAGVTILRTTSGEAMDIPKATVHSTSASATEGSAITESDPTFAKTSLTVAKAGYVVQVSREMVDDSGVDLLGYLSRAAGRELGNAVGSNAVSVLLTGTSSAVTGPTGASGGFGTQSTAGSGFDKVIDLFYSIIEPYRRRSSCGWVMADPTAAVVRKIKTSDGYYIWQPSVIQGQPDTILNKPVYIDTNVPDVALSAESVVFGDLSSLYVRIAGGFRFERSDDFAFGSDLVTFRALVRHGAAHVDPNATKSFVGAGT